MDVSSAASVFYSPSFMVQFVLTLLSAGPGLTDTCVGMRRYPDRLSPVKSIGAIEEQKKQRKQKQQISYRKNNEKKRSHQLRPEEIPNKT